MDRKTPKLHLPPDPIPPLLDPDPRIDPDPPVAYHVTESMTIGVMALIGLIVVVVVVWNQ